MLAGGADLELGCQEEGRGADATPDLQSSKLSCPRQDRPEATVTGLLKPKRSPRVSARRQDQGGNWRPSYLSLNTYQGPEPLLQQSRRLGGNTQGFVNGRAGPCYTHPAFAP
jgi:hypothetical protein